MHAIFEVIYIDETMIVINDLDNGISVKDDAEYVADKVGQEFEMGNRKLIYRDKSGRYDELVIIKHRFTGFKSCEYEQQRHYQDLFKIVRK